jgi:hypothetical protein
MQYGFDAANLTALQRGDRHMHTRFRGMNNVSLHPLQRTGLVSASSHDTFGAQGANDHPGLGDTRFPAGHMNLTLPPVVPIHGSPRDPAFQI